MVTNGLGIVDSQDDYLRDTCDMCCEDIDILLSRPSSSEPDIIVSLSGYDR